MGLLIRTVQRIAIFTIGVVSVWLIVFVVFDFADKELPVYFALLATYAIGAYVILPYAVRMGLKVSQRRHVPSFTVAADGLPADPVNLVLVGTLDQLRAAFAAIGWVEAEKLNLGSSWRMVKAFVLDRPYPAAPFSTLFLFGRGQDVGFEKAIGDSPRKRHHVRFWGRSLKDFEDVDTASFWLNTDVPPPGADVPWVGAGTRDTGFGLASLTFQSYARDRQGYERRARLHHGRAAPGRRHRRSGVAEHRRLRRRQARQSLHHRRRRRRCGAGKRRRAAEGDVSPASPLSRR